MNRKYPRNFDRFIDEYFKEYIEAIYPQYKERFESITGAFIDDDVFLDILLNAKLFPHVNTKNQALSLMELHFEQNFKLGDAASMLYGQRLDAPTYIKGKPFDVSRQEFSEKGWYLSRGYLSRLQVDGIKQQLNDFKFHMIHSNYHDLSREEILSDRAGRLEKTLFASQLTDKVIEEDSPLGKLFTDKKIVSTVANIAGCPMYLVESSTIISKPVDDDDDGWKLHSQSWHIDYSHLKFIKVFIFLSDIPSAGYCAHSYVEGSNGSKLIYPVDKSDFWQPRFQKSGKLFGTIKDEWVKRAYPEDSIHTFCGNQGDILFEDTSGLHKGERCKSGGREFLQLLFAVSNYGSIYTEKQFQLNAKAIYPDRTYLSPVAVTDAAYQKKNTILMPKRSFIRKVLSPVKQFMLRVIGRQFIQ